MESNIQSDPSTSSEHPHHSHQIDIGALEQQRETSTYQEPMTN